MPTRISRADQRPITYEPALDRHAQVSLAIQCILEGRPLPEHLRPVTPVLALPPSVEAGIARILGQ